MSTNELSLKQLEDLLRAQISKEAADFNSLSTGVVTAESNGIGNRVNRLFNPDFSLTAKGANLSQDPGIGWSHISGNPTYMHSFSLPNGTYPNAGTPRVAQLPAGCVIQSPAMLIEGGHGLGTDTHWATGSISATGSGSVSLSYVDNSGNILGTYTVAVSASKYTAYSFTPVQITTTQIGIYFKIQVLTGSVNISLVNGAWGTAPVAVPNNNFDANGYFKKVVDALDSRIGATETALPTKAALVHQHSISEVTNLQGALDGKSANGHIHSISEVTNLQGSLDLKSNTNHIHQDLIDSIATKHSKNGDELHTGGFRVSKAPTLLDDVVRLGDIGQTATEVKVGDGSTLDSGYAVIGNLAYAWVRSANTWFSPSVQPSLVLKTPITFDKIYSYALSTENDETVIYDNDSWWQMAQGYGGNTFPVFGQNCGNSGLGGWQRAVLYVVGTAAAHVIAISNVDLSFMAANGQVYPLVKIIQLSATGTLGSVNWTIQGITGGATAEFVSGSTDKVQVSLPAVGDFDLTVKVTDSLGSTTIKTIKLTVTAYQLVTLAITTEDFGIIADSYPITINSGILTATGGSSPYEWSIIAGTGTTTTNLPSAAIVTVAGGKAVSGTVSSAGNYRVNIQAKDSATPEQTVSKVINCMVSTYVIEDPVYCFEAEETYVLMETGLGKLLKNVRGGDYILTTSEGQHNRGGRGLSKSLVTSVALVPYSGIEPDGLIIKGVKTTNAHHWAKMIDGPVGPGDWIKAKEITEDTLLIQTDGGEPVAVKAGPISATGPIQLAGNLETQARSYYVSSNPNGPWFLVHNYQLNEPSYD